MISENRIVAVFSKGGDGGSTATSQRLSQSTRDFLESRLNGERILIARVQSQKDWMAITSSQLVCALEDRVLRTPLSEIVGVETKGRGEQLLECKQSGGNLGLRLTDGSEFAVRVDGGKPFVGLLNVFQYIARINRGRRSRRAP